MKHRILVWPAIVAAALVAAAACSSSTGSTRTTAPDGVFTLARGGGFDSSGAFLTESTCNSSTDYSPGLMFESVPAGTAELAVSMVDLTNHKVHWLQIGLSGTAPGIQAHTLTPGARELLNDLGEGSYDGPCPPAGQTHQYQLTLYAFSKPLPASFGHGTKPSATLMQLQSEATASAMFVAPYTRN